jgi:hypothetical protein
MNDEESNSNRFYCKLKEEIKRVSGKTMLLRQLLGAVEGLSPDLPAWLQSPEGWPVFAAAVRKLVAEGLIAPIGKITTHELYLKYRIIRQSEAKEGRVISQIVRSIEPPASVDFYLKNPQYFLADRDVIEIISDFLKQPSHEPAPINERAYQLFGDEKFFKGDRKERSRGETVLKRLGLDYADIGCFETAEPFFSFHHKDLSVRNARRIYIIENKDTFWSFKKRLMDVPSRFRPDMLIYGEGRKVLSSFKFVAEYDLNRGDDTFFYFGDLDAEGINIYCELKEAYPQYRIQPFVEGYQAVFEIGSAREIRKTPKAQKVKPENIGVFIEMFAPVWAAKLAKILEEGRYIPQEALSAAQMKVRFGKGWE